MAIFLQNFRIFNVYSACDSEFLSHVYHETTNWKSTGSHKIAFK